MTHDAHDWEGIKQAYVHGDWSLKRIGDANGVSAYKVRARAKKDGWKRLVGTKTLCRGRKPRAASTARKRPAVADELRRRDMLCRLLDALDKRLTQLEARMASDAEAGGEPQTAADAERDARTLSGLARLYAKLVELDGGAHRGGGEGKEQEGALRQETADDAEFFRRDLALRLQRLNQARRS